MELQRQPTPSAAFGPANVLILPGLHSANIGAKLLQRIGGATILGPLIGLDKPARSCRSAPRQRPGPPPPWSPTKRSRASLRNRSFALTARREGAGRITALYQPRLRR